MLQGMHAEIVVAGHVCLDLIPFLDGPASIEPGRLIRVGEVALSTGGAVANTGVALHRLGVPVRLMGKVGDDLFGGAVLDALAAHGLAEGMLVSAGEATSYSIVINPPGVDRSFLHCPGANDTFGADDVPVAAVAGARIFHFGYPPLMRRMIADDGAELERLLARVREAGLVTSLDMCQPPATEAGRTDWRAVLARTLPHVDVFCPSIDELLLMLGRPAGERREPRGALDRAYVAELAGELLDLGAAVVAIKLGEQGLYLHTSGHVGELCRRLGLDATAWSDREVLSSCFRASAVAGTTGAGDCTIAGLLAALLRGEDPTEAATAATAVGACCVEAADATSGIPPWPEVAERLAAGWERLPSEVT